MKIGDLVMLSSYGLSLKTYYAERSRDVALIEQTHSHGSWFTIRWLSDLKRETLVQRRDLKYAKIKE